jgi:hypothetical protein
MRNAVPCPPAAAWLRRFVPAGVTTDFMPDIRIGTSAFTAQGGEGSFYPKGMKLADFSLLLRHKV